MLVVGSGGVGSAIAAIAERRSFFDHMALADRDGEPCSARGLGPRGSRSLLVPPARRLRSQAIVAAARETGADVIVNAADPRLNPPIFAAAFEARCTYLDMAMTLSEPHPERPYEEPGVKLGDRQFAEHERWQEAGPARAPRDRRRTGPLRRLRPLRGRSPLFVDRRDRCSRRGKPRRRGLRLRPDVLDLDDDRGVPQSATHLGARARLVHDRALLRARGLRLPGGDRPGRMRERRARGGRPRSRARSTAGA